MKFELLENKKELPKEAPLTFPAVESFSDSSTAIQSWPKKISGNEHFLEQIESRRILNENLDTIISHIPNPTISLGAALDREMITAKQVADLYNSLSELLEDGDYGRVLLYLPFEFLPNESWNPGNQKLKEAAERLRKTYMQAWHKLLYIHDVRANFVDGDIAEVHYRNDGAPRVVKAAHLISKLVESGMMTCEDAISLMEKSDDQILKNSIADTLPVLADMGFLAEKEIGRMKESHDRLVNNMARIILSNQRTGRLPVESASRTITLPSIQEELGKEFLRIDSDEYGDITEKRRDWLTNRKKKDAIESLGKHICSAILEGGITDETVANVLAPETKSPSQQAFVEGIRMAIEDTALADSEYAQKLYGEYREILMALWKNATSETKEVLAKTFRRLRQISIIDDRQLEELGISMPKLAGPFSENIESMKDEMSNIRDMIKSVESDKELSQLIYPVALIYGSCLKGYGEQNADLDLAVFVKPGVSFDHQPKLQEMLRRHFRHEKIRDKIVEFWLEEKDGQLIIRDPADLETSIGESHWTYILFGAAWEGNKDAIQELREKVLVPYMQDSGKKIYGRDARSIYIEELERDTLQYRLMHKGYERFYPPHGGIHTEHAEDVDGESMFWDSGYRRLATKLYANRVFIPKITA